MIKLLEYEGKKLLHSAGISVPKSFIAGSTPAFLPAVLKSQVPVGGRGKAGGVVTVRSKEDYVIEISKLHTLAIKGFTPRTILAESVLTIDRELYLSFVIDKVNATIQLVAHRMGGVEVEDNNSTDFLKMPLTHTSLETIGQRLADHYDLQEQTSLLQELVEKLYRCFCEQDITLLEINPLILTTAGELIAGDAKIVLDDAAAFRHNDWDFEDREAETNFVTLNEQGTVATIANGAGLAMATVDAVADIGMLPSNFLDIGGGATEASVLAAFERIVEYPNIRVIVVNIFAGITRCDEVAKAIIAARSLVKQLPPLVIRLAGTNYEQAAELLENYHIPIYKSLDDALVAAKAEL